jgi:cytochrome c
MMRVLLLSAVVSGLICGARAGDLNIAVGDARRGAALVETLGCGGCHRIPSVARARGRVGPSLAGIADRVMIAGLLPNTPGNLMRWIRTPQEVVPGNAMPNLEINDHDAHDVAAFLYTLH